MDQVRALGKEGTANIYELSSGSYEITGALNADPSVLRDRLAEIDLDFYTQNYADQGLSTVYQSAADYLAGGVYTEERLDTLLENLESCLSALACVSRPQEEGMVCIGDYTRFPNEAAYQITTASEWIYFCLLYTSLPASDESAPLKNHAASRRAPHSPAQNARAGAAAILDFHIAESHSGGFPDRTASCGAGVDNRCV